jgi:hypothetical protein
MIPVVKVAEAIRPQDASLVDYQPQVDPHAAKFTVERDGVEYVVIVVERVK